MVDWNTITQSQQSLQYRRTILNVELNNCDSQGAQGRSKYTNRLPCVCWDWPMVLVRQITSYAIYSESITKVNAQISC